MNARFSRLIQPLILFMDVIVLNGSIMLGQIILDSFPEESQVEYTRFWILLNTFWLVVTWLVNLYKENSITSFESFLRLTMHAFIYWLILSVSYLYFAHQFELSRFFIAIVFLCYGFSLLFNRFIFLFIQSFLKKHRILAQRVLIIGYNETGKKLASYLEEENMQNEIVGFCEDMENVNELSNYPIVDCISNSVVASLNHQVDEIYSTIAPEQNANIYKIIQEADQACIHFHLIPDLSYFIKRTFYVDYLKDIPVISLRQEPLSDAGNRVRKRLFDIILSLFVIVFIFSWLLPLIAVIIFLESPGPILFKQLRTGKGGKPFRCFKFRSMKVNRESDIRQATINDNRLTKFGRLMRKTSLDELPQFFNVLIGEMSIVGPRPHMLKHTNDYSKLIDQYMIRQFIRPGITGWAQINGYRGETKTLEKMQGRVKHDIWYMENWTIWLDARIILLTIYMLFKGDDHAF